MGAAKIAKDPNQYRQQIAGALRHQMSLSQLSHHPLAVFADLQISPYLKLVDELIVSNGLDVLIDRETKEPIGAVGYGEAPVWWAKEGVKALVEVFIISLNGISGFGRLAAQHLENVATQRRCSFIVTGNALATTAPDLAQQVHNLYMKKAKFDVAYSQFIKVVGGN